MKTEFSPEGKQFISTSQPYLEYKILWKVDICLCYELLYIFSYDENLRLWDKRNWKNPTETFHAQGGIWRIKQPKTKDKYHDLIGLACMHNGFQLLKVFRI